MIVYRKECMVSDVKRLRSALRALAEMFGILDEVISLGA